MRTAIHTVVILLVGLGLGFGIREFRRQRSTGPGADEVVYTNDNPVPSRRSADEPASSDEVATGEPVHPGKPERPTGDYDWMKTFELTERTGETVSSEELLGQPYIVSFFFTTCPGTCVQQNQKLKELQDEFEGQGIRFVAISCDPVTDTPEALREYAARFGADKDQWLFMTGELDYIRRVGAEIYLVGVEEKFHTEKFILVDATGEVEGHYTWGDERQFKLLRKTIGEMIEEKAAS